MRRMIKYQFCLIVKRAILPGSIVLFFYSSWPQLSVHSSKRLFLILFFTASYLRNGSFTLLNSTENAGGFRCRNTKSARKPGGDLHRSETNFCRRKTFSARHGKFPPGQSERRGKMSFGPVEPFEFIRLPDIYSFSGLPRRRITRRLWWTMCSGLVDDLHFCRCKSSRMHHWIRGN